MSSHDVFEYIVDGTSGLVPGDVSGKALIAGVCSKGTAGKIYYLGKSSDLNGLLGAGPLVDRLNDIFTVCGQSATVLAVPVPGSPAGYIGAVEHIGEGPEIEIHGLAAINADVVISVTDGGAPGVAKVKISNDGGENFDAATVVPENGQITINDTGVTIVLEFGDLIKDDSYSFVVRSAIGPVEQIGHGPQITAAGTVTMAAQILMQVVKSGGRNKGQYKISTDGGDNYGPYRTIPIDGLISVGDTGVSISFPEGEYTFGTEYCFDLMAPVPTITSVIESLALPLESIDPEFVHICGPSDSIDWTALGSLADDLFNKHRPTIFTCESRLPNAAEDLNDFTTAMKIERRSVSARFVAVCTAFGETTNRTGESVLRNAGGLLAGRILSIPVQRDIGRVRDQGITPLKLPEGYAESMQSELETAGFITATTYAGLSGVYWGDARTLADATSDYQYLEVLRVTFKAIRLLRIQALKSLKDEAGDPILGLDASGLSYLKANLENALDTMTKAKPKEMAAYVVNIPDGQDIVNNGVAVEVTLIGIPIIKSIKLYASYVYAGSSFDPRLSA
ncbi:DUF2586 domain-containing protein [Maridesulfovibrio bastinii]|uniref:DUF2586 domain-containing protein n=1 Tax=Maridesulfovibrio bastinii TaxID=47157 RepID=UPI000426FD78|nr:DUF2586 domain-containing protein [Maridesulfovibrio bastinii]